jgi:hypothetical protein
MASATQLKLAPANGQNLNINGLVQQVPAAGIIISNAGLAASTLYYVYAYMNAGSMALELSTTGHAQGANGVETKNGDTTRTLVGMAYTSAASQFVDDGATNLCVLSYFNRRRKMGRARFTATRMSNNDPAAFAEVHTEIRVNFLTWADEPVRQVICGSWTVSGGGTGYCYASIDSDTAGLRSWQGHSAATSGSFSTVDERLVAEGYHYGTLVAHNNGGTAAQFVGGANGEATQTLTVMG